MSRTLLNTVAVIAASWGLLSAGTGCEAMGFTTSEVEQVGALVKVEPVHSGTLERTLEHPHGVVRVQAALKLWELGTDAQAILPVLTEALQAEDPDVILYAARGLGRLGPAAKAAASRLEALAEHDSEVIRRAAAGALTLIR